MHYWKQWLWASLLWRRINRLIENPEFAEGLGREAKKICEKLNGPAIIDQWRKYIEKIIEE